MNKHEANQIINQITNFSSEGLDVTQAIQSAVNSFVADYKKHNPNENFSILQWKFEKQASNLTKSFQQAMRYKLKELERERFNQQNKSIEPSNEKEYLIKDVAESLGVSSQNVNALVKKHNLPMREVSQRKRYLPESTIQLLRTGKYK